MMSLEYLPGEVLVKIFEFLAVGDLLTVNLVCQKWRAAAAIVLEEKVVVMATEDLNPGIDTFIKCFVHFKHWVFKNIDINYKGSFKLMWEQYSDYMKSLTFADVEIHERDLITMLRSCYNLEHLFLAGFSHMFMTGTFLENDEDIITLRKSLRNVITLRLSCSRYLTDAIFYRISSVVGPLKDICLAGCQISYQNSIWKRFYPSDGSVKASEHVLTYNFVLNFIENNKDTLRKLNLGRTSIDSESLSRLSQIPGLNLESLHLMACDQLTKSGIQLLTQNQKNLIDLDISLCSRITDYAIISIADNLPYIKKLSIRRCHGVTETGLENIIRMKHLEKLDISYLDVRKWESIHEALGKLKRSSMRWLSVASLPIQWETVLALADTMPNLRYLDLSMCIMGLTDKTIQAICKSMVKLEILFLNGCAGVSDIGLSGHGLGNRQIPTPDTGGMQLSLETLGLKDRNPYKIALGSKAERIIRQEGEVRRYLENHMEQIISSSEYGLLNLQGLKQLNLCGCLRITDLTLCHAIQFKELTYLNLSHCQQITEEGLIQVTINCPSLESLLLTECSNTTDRVILVLAHRLRRIKTLDLQRCSSLTNDALDSLSSCRNLRYLDISGCDKMTLEEVEVLRKRIPRLLDLHHRGIKSHSEEPDTDELMWGGNKAPTPPPLLSKLVRKLTR